MPRNVIKKCLELPREEVEWFERTYPGGSLTAIVTYLLEKYRINHKLTPAEIADMAARDVIGEFGKS